MELYLTFRLHADAVGAVPDDSVEHGAAVISCAGFSFVCENGELAGKVKSIQNVFIAFMHGSLPVKKAWDPVFQRLFQGDCNAYAN
jgi:hypothetical protein